MVINKIFINKKTGNLILITCDYFCKDEKELEVYNQFKDIGAKIRLANSHSITPYINYTKKQLDKNWIQVSKLTTFISKDEKVRLFSFRYDCYRQKFSKHFKTISFNEVYYSDYLHILKNREKFEKKNNYNVLRKIQTAKYYNYDLLIILKDL